MSHDPAKCLTCKAAQSKRAATNDVPSDFLHETADSSWLAVGADDATRDATEGEF